MKFEGIYHINRKCCIDNLVNTAFFVLPNWYNAKFLKAKVAQKQIHRKRQIKQCIEK